MDPIVKAVNDLRRDLDRTAAQHPIWSPEPGDTLIGELIRYQLEQTLDGGGCQTAIIRDIATRNLVAVWITDSSLIDSFRRQKPTVGELVGIKRLPDPEGNNGFFYALCVHRSGEVAVPDFGNPYGDYGRPPDNDVPF